MKVGLALGGGGARGISHVGVLRVLEAEDIPVDIICGTSMGSVIGAIYAADPDASRLESNVREYYHQHELGGSWLKFLSKNKEEFKRNLFVEMSYYIRKRYMTLVALRRVGLEVEETLRKPLEQLLPDINIEDLKIPFAATAINLTKGEETIFSKGSLIDAVYASSAIEGIFPPLKKEGDLYSDGGPTSNVPVEACRKLGADFVIAVSLPFPTIDEGKFSNGLDVILRADNIAVKKLGKRLLEDADTIITPNVEDVHWAAFDNIDHCVDSGDQAARVVLPTIRKELRKRRSPFRKARTFLASKLQ